MAGGGLDAMGLTRPRSGLAPGRSATRPSFLFEARLAHTGRDSVGEDPGRLGQCFRQHLFQFVQVTNGLHLAFETIRDRVEPGAHVPPDRVPENCARRRIAQMNHSSASNSTFAPVAAASEGRSPEKRIAATPAVIAIAKMGMLRNMLHLLVRFRFAAGFGVRGMQFRCAARARHTNAC
jgi:hypothetical protein